jgi:hypothetical protein
MVFLGLPARVFGCEVTPKDALNNRRRLCKICSAGQAVTTAMARSRLRLIAKQLIENRVLDLMAAPRKKEEPLGIYAERLSRLSAAL